MHFLLVLKPTTNICCSNSIATDEYHVSNTKNEIATSYYTMYFVLIDPLTFCLLSPYTLF